MHLEKKLTRTYHTSVSRIMLMYNVYIYLFFNITSLLYISSLFLSLSVAIAHKYPLGLNIFKFTTIYRDYIVDTRC